MNEKKKEPVWLSVRVDQRIAFMLERTGGEFPPGALIATLLTEPPEGASKEEIDRWDRTCDNCGKYVPKGQTLYTGSCDRTLPSGHQVIINFGACSECFGEQ